MPKEADDKWMWAHRMRDCLAEIQPIFTEIQPPVVDYELIPDFSGKPDDMVVGFICNQRVDKPDLENQKDAPRAQLQTRMKEHGFPDSTVESVRVGSASVEEIEGTGGRFYYFR